MPDLRTPGKKGFKASDFSYNTGSLRCPGCDGTGEVSLDVQFLPDVNIVCPDCRGSRYARAAYGVKLMNKAGQAVSLPELMDMDVNSALAFCGGMKTVSQRLQTLQQAGSGLPDAGRRDAQPLRRRGPAPQAGQRDRPHPDRLGVRFR